MRIWGIHLKHWMRSWMTWMWWALRPFTPPPGRNSQRRIWPIWTRIWICTEDAFAEQVIGIPSLSLLIPRQDMLGEWFVAGEYCLRIARSRSGGFDPLGR